MTVVEGLLHDLAVRFGSQVRLKCPSCTRFLRDTGDRVECAACGAAFDRQDGTVFSRAAS